MQITISKKKFRSFGKIPPLINLSFLWSPSVFSEMRPLEVIAVLVLLSSIYDGGRLKFVGSGFTFSNFASFKEFACTGDRGANSGEETVKEAGGGVDNGKLEGVLPAAAFFSICSKSKSSHETHSNRISSTFTGNKSTNLG